MRQLPGDNLTRNNRFAQLLMNQPSPNNGTTAGGIAHVLNQGLAGYLMGKDSSEKSAMMKALMGGMTQPTLAPGMVQSDMGNQVTPEALEDSGEGGSPGMVEQQAQTVMPSAPPPGGLRGGLTALQGMPDNEHAQNMYMPLAMKLADRDATTAAATAAADLAFQRQKELKQIVPGKAPAETWSTIKDDSGNIIGQIGSVSGQVKSDPRASKKYLPVPGLGVYNTQTGAMITPQNAGGLPQGAGSRPHADSVPTAPPLAPIPGVSPKGNEKMAVDAFNRADAELVKSRESLVEANNIEELAARFEELMKVQNTGGVGRNLPLAGTIEGALDPEIREMRSIVDKITPNMRQGLPGAASERDTAMFKNSAFGTDKDPQTNRNIIIGLKTQAQNARDRQTFREAFLAKNRHLNGADASWNKYLEANPIFDPSSPVESPMINPNRKTWSEHFGGKPDLKSKYGLE